LPAFRVQGHEVFQGGRKEAVGTNDVGLDELFRRVDGAVHVAFGCQVEDRAGPVFFEKAPHQFRVADVTLDEGVAGVVFQVGEGRPVAGIGQLVEVDHSVPAPQAAPYKVGTDETAAPGDQYQHRISSKRNIKVL